MVLWNRHKATIYRIGRIWWLSYTINDVRQRQSSHSTNKEVAKRILKNELRKLVPDKRSSLSLESSEHAGIYFIEGSGLTKIGSSVCVVKRYANIQSSSPVKISPISWLPIYSTLLELNRLERTNDSKSTKPRITVNASKQRI